MSEYLKESFSLDRLMHVMPESVLKPCFHCGALLCFVEKPPFICVCDVHLCEKCAKSIHEQWGAHGGCSTRGRITDGERIVGARIKKISPGLVSSTEILVAKIIKNGSDLKKALEVQKDGKISIQVAMAEHEAQMIKIVSGAGVGSCAFNMDATKALGTRGLDIKAGKLEWTDTEEPETGNLKRPLQWSGTPKNVTPKFRKVLETGQATPVRQSATQDQEECMIRPRLNKNTNE
jgi:hypothetical protein